MIKREYTAKILELLQQNKQLFNVRQLETKAGMPVNSLTKTLNGTRHLDASEAWKIAKVLGDLAFAWSGYNLSESEFKNLKYF